MVLPQPPLRLATRIVLMRSSRSRRQPYGRHGGVQPRTPGPFDFRPQWRYTGPPAGRSPCSTCRRFSLFAASLTVASGSPGPSIAALVARVLTRGPRSVLPFLAAMWIGEAIWLACAVFGLAVIAQTFQTAFAALKIGGRRLSRCFLAWKMWTAPVAEAEPLPDAGSGWRLFGAGLAVTLGNPKIMVFYLALLRDRRPRRRDRRRLARAHLVMALVLIAVDLAWVLAAARPAASPHPAGRRLANRLPPDGRRRRRDRAS